jgi:hypothetical protein
MNLYPPVSVEEESSDSCEDEDEPAEGNALEFNPKNFYWVFNPEMNFSSRKGFSVSDDINP